MAVWGKITVTGWPHRVRIGVKLREGSESGTPLAGDVVIRIRKQGEPGSTRKLGLHDDDLVANVVDGEWQSGEEWDYSFWSRQGFNTLVANFQGQRAYWNSDHKEIGRKKDSSVPMPTSISKIQFTGAVDNHNPEIIGYAITWTILDQDRKPIAGKVTVVFDGTTETRDSEPTRPGVCFDKVIVSGYGKEMFYSVLPPVGEPQIIKLSGPTKKVDTRTKIDPANRFKVGVEGDRIAAKQFSAVIPLDTLDEFGTPGASKVETTLISGRHATFTDARTSAVLGSNVRYCELTTSPDGSYHLGVSFKGQTEIVLDVRHQASEQKRTLRLVYEQ